jgi:membrane-associated phospholipid phosphatase
VSTLLIIGVVGSANALPVSVRLWLGLAYVAAGYWLPALLRSGGPDERFTAWLMTTDAWFPRMGPVPSCLAHAADVCYLLCYFVVPAGYAAIASRGNLDDQERFWTAVLASGFACYATLPWLVSLPPRRLAPGEGEQRPVSSLNLALLQRVSHGYNTFPSGHAAVSTAVAMATVPVPWVAAVCAVIAVGVATGAVIGRHHFKIDVLAGIATGIAATMASGAAR